MAKGMFPFVCVSGVNSIDATQTVIRAIPKDFPKTHTVIAGLLTTSRTLQGIAEEKHPSRFVDVKVIPKVANFAKEKKLAYVIHHRSMEEKELASDLTQIMQIVNKELAAIQIDAIPNVSFVDPKVLLAFKKKFPSVALILQVGPKAFEEVAGDSKELCKRLLKYGNAIDAVLLDRSDSRGIPLDAQELGPLIKAMRKNCPQYQCVVAGGLNAKTMKNITPLVKESKQVSIDAESAFFTTNKTKRIESFSPIAVQSYLNAFKEMMK